MFSSDTLDFLKNFQWFLFTTCEIIYSYLGLFWTPFRFSDLLGFFHIDDDQKLSIVVATFIDLFY